VCLFPRDAHRQQSADPLTKDNDGTLHGGATSKFAAVEIAIGDAVIRAGTEVDEAYLARVIRAVRAA
jgi:transposase